jgi:hypothetical protein
MRQKTDGSYFDLRGAPPRAGCEKADTGANFTAISLLENSLKSA